MRDRSLVPALAALLLLAAGLAGVIIGSASRGSFASAGSTYRAAPDGARGLYLFAGETGLPVSRRHLDLEVIEEETSGVFVLLGVAGGSSCEARRPHSKSVDEEASEDDEEEQKGKRSRGRVMGSASSGGRLGALECLALREWVEAGGRLVHVVGSHDALLASMGLVFTRAKDRQEGSETLVQGQPSNLVAGVESVFAPIAGYVRSTDGDEVVLLVTESDLRSVAVARRYGEGRVVAIAAPAMATNRWLGEADNSVFWASLLQGLGADGGVSFVEHHHGHQNERSIIAYLFGRGLLPVVFQVSLVFFVGVAAARRLGLPLAVPRERARSEGDLLSAMSRIYRLGNHAEHAGEVIASRAIEEASRLGFDPRVAAAVESLKGARTRLRARAKTGQADEDDVAEVARRAAAVYDALAGRRRPRKATKRSGERRNP